MVWYGMVWYGMVWYCIVWYCIVLYCIVLYCIVLYRVPYSAEHPVSTNVFFTEFSVIMFPKNLNCGQDFRITPYNYYAYSSLFN